MKKILVFLFLIILILVLRVVLFYFFHINNLMPDFFLILIIYISIFKGVLVGEYAGFFVGLIKDAFGLGIFGTSALLFTILGFILGKMSEKIEEENIVIQIFITFFATIYYIIGFYVIQSLFNYKFNAEFNWYLLYKPFINVMIIPFIYLLYNRIKFIRKEVVNNVA